MVLKRTFKCFTAVVLKWNNCRQLQSTAATVLCRLSAEEAEAGLDATYVLPALW